MLRRKLTLAAALYFAFAGAAPAEEPWMQALSRMPLPRGLRELNWSNCVPELLQAFASNDLVKAIVIMPGATDELYTFRRVRCTLPEKATVADAIAGLTHAGLLDVQFQAPFILIHTGSDLFEPAFHVEAASTLQKLQKPGRVSHLLFFDKDWDAVQPVLKRSLRVDLKPWRGSQASWHFYRHSLAAYGLTGWETVQAICLTGKTKATIRSGSVVFEPDTRPRTSPRVNAGLPGH